MIAYKPSRNAKVDGMMFNSACSNSKDKNYQLA